MENNSTSYNRVLEKIPAAFEFDETKKGKRPPIALTSEFIELLSNNSIASITQKIDGENHAVLEINGTPTLCIRRDIKKGAEPPAGWIQTHEPQGTHNIGYLALCVDEPTNRWAINCFKKNEDGTINFKKLLVLVKNEQDKYVPTYVEINPLLNLSLELIGPKVQNNKDDVPVNCFVIHGSIEAKFFPNLTEFGDFETLIVNVNEWFDVNNIEGVVIRFQNNSMFKLTQNMLGRKWTKRTVSLLEDIF